MPQFKNAPVVQWIEYRIPVPTIGVRLPTGVRILKSFQTKAAKRVYLAAFFVLIRAVIENSDVNPVPNSVTSVISAICFMSSNRRTYVFPSEDVRFWDGGRMFLVRKT